MADQSSEPPSSIFSSEQREDEHEQMQEQVQEHVQEHNTPDFDPTKQIDQYDWELLELQFQEALAKLEEEENGLSQEFEELTEYFRIWAATMCDTDSERASKRLKTRIARVQISEEALEEKRKHYIRVVGAFQNALKLLNGI